MLQIMDTQKLSKFWPHYPNESKSDFTPIEYAAMNGHTDIVKILAPLTVNPNETKSFFTVTPIERAVMKGNMEMVKILASSTGTKNLIKSFFSLPML